MAENKIEKERACEKCNSFMKICECGEKFCSNKCEDSYCSKCHAQGDVIVNGDRYQEYMRSQAAESIRIIEYIMFGILIALFYYQADYPECNQAYYFFTRFSFCTALISLILLFCYYYSQYIKFYDLYVYKTEHRKHVKFRERAHAMFRFVIIFSAIPIISFVILTFLHFG